MPDLRGFGLSDKPCDENAYLPECFASDLIGIMNKEEIKKAHLYGNSISGIIAFYIEAMYPQYFHSLIIQGIALYNIMQFKQFLIDILEQYKDESIVKFVDGLSAFFNQSFPSKIRDAMELCLPRALYQVSKTYWPEISQNFALLKKPCLMIYGEHEDVNIIKDMRFAAEAIPNCEIAVIPDHNHVEASWAGENVAKIIVNFVNKHFSS